MRCLEWIKKDNGTPPTVFRCRRCGVENGREGDWLDFNFLTTNFCSHCVRSRFEEHLLRAIMEELNIKSPESDQ